MSGESSPCRESIGCSHLYFCNISLWRIAVNFDLNRGTDRRKKKERKKLNPEDTEKRKKRRERKGEEEKREIEKKRGGRGG